MNMSKSLVLNERSWSQSGIFTKKWVASIISGFSGVWKDSLIREFLQKHNNSTKAVSVTSRKQRNWEIDTKDYYFLTKSRVESLLQAWELLDSFINSKWDIYGLPRNELKKLCQYKTVFFNIVPESGRKIQEIEPLHSLPIVLVPRNFQEWKKRLMNREDGMEHSEKKSRIQQDLDVNFKDDLLDIEKSMKNGKYHYNGEKYFLINEEWKLDEAVEYLGHIISNKIKEILL